MDAPRRSRRADPEFDPPPASTVRLRDFDPPEYQRLVVNPFLAVLGLIAWCRATLVLYSTWFPPLIVPAVVVLCFLPGLIQYHCLDCGQTGRYSRRAGHACPAVFARCNEGRRARVPFASARAQLVVWGWLIGSAALLLAVLGLG